MAWTVTLKSVARDPNNPLNVRAVVEFTDGRATFERTTFGDNLTPGAIKQWAYGVLQSRAASDTSESDLSALVGQSITVEAPPQDSAALVQFRQRWKRLMLIKKLDPKDANLVAQAATLQGQVDAYLVANPSAIDDPLIG